ncbi:MAG: hypothetical protein LHV68_03550 [Elusimicrobia bacterium]|nr:hypothetical protein [Candidatus Liberimonas magnetica]
MNKCAIKIGNIGIIFYCPSAGWVSFIKRNYAYFLSRNDSRYKVLLKNDRVGINIKGLEVTERNKSYEIRRNDFYSFSEPGFKRTFLNAQRNKYSFDSWLRIFITLLAIENKGFLLHSSGVYLNSTGSFAATYLFPGVSGKGKSSLINILGKKIALSDELVYLFKRSGYFQAASTPFWGELEKGPGNIYSARLKGLYFINHGPDTALNKLTLGKGIKKLLKTVMFFSKKPSHIKKLLLLLEGTAREIPMFNLYFSLKSTKKDIINKILLGEKKHGN